MPKQIAQINEKTHDMLKTIKEDIKELIVTCETQKNTKKEISDEVEKVHNQLHEFNTSPTTAKNEIITEEKKPVKKNINQREWKDKNSIPRTLTIKNKKLSSSFAAWAFNNKEL